MDTNAVSNICYLEPELTSLAYYSHLIPVILSLALATLIFFKTKFSFLSKTFILFIITFCMWLIGDLITWTSTNYALIYSTWSFLLYLEVVFYSLGLYFALVFVRKSDIATIYKVLLFLLTLVPLVFTVAQRSVTGFNYPVCEVFNNDFLDSYKLAVEGFILVVILLYSLNPLFRTSTWKEKKGNLIVLGSMFLFFATFGITEYLASVTGNYQMNMYSLFLMPIFLVAIIYSVFELDIFNLKILGTHYIVVGLVILMAGQLFFIDNATNQLLTVLAIFLAVILSFILFRNLKKESDQRVQIAKLNLDLQDLLKQRESLVHLVTHKVKGSFTRSKYIYAGILDGTFGETSPEIKKIAEQGLESDNMGIETVDLVLNVANMQKGTVKYEMKPINLREIVEKSMNEKKVVALARGLTVQNNISEGTYNILGDAFWIKEAINNLLENSIKYTKTGGITVNLEKQDKKVLLSVKDTGVGITAEDKKGLFTEGGRGKDSVKVNVDSTGYGLYSVKLIIDAHKGRVWAESEGQGLGSTFFIELNTA